jgi:hypothetical protein
VYISRRAQQPRPIEDRPSASADVARRRPKAAHTWLKSLTDAVFHAPMFALNAYTWNPLELRNAYEPSHA